MKFQVYSFINCICIQFANPCHCITVSFNWLRAVSDMDVLTIINEMTDVYDPLVERYWALIGSLKHFILRSPGKLVTFMTFEHVIMRPHVCTTDVSRQ